MIKKYIYILILVFLSVNKLYAQIHVKGQVKDVNDKPIELIEVLLQNKDSLLIKSELTNVEGRFTLIAEKGQYMLSIKQLGVILYSKKIDLNQNLDLSVIQVKEGQHQLKEVAVTFKKKIIERKIDRIIFNVENSISAAGGDAIDALKITPAIKVQNEAITMIGKNKMSIMIDDRLIELSGDDLINFLKTIRTDDIKSIEVITNPPAKYDAEGNSGLVNIKLKKAKLDSWNVSLNSSYKQSTYATLSNGGSFNYQKKKLSFFTNLNYVNGSKKGLEQEEIAYSSQTWNNEFKRKAYTNIFSGRFGIDYKLSENWTIGAQYLGSLNKPRTVQDDHTIITHNGTQTIDSLINSRSDDLKKTNSSSVNIHSMVKLDSTGKNISFDLDYFNLDNHINRGFQTQNSYADFAPTPGGYQSATNSGFQDINIYSAKIDITDPLKWIKLSYGGKVYFSKTNYDNKYFDMSTGVPLFQTNQSNTFQYTENTQALYISGNKKITDKWEIKLGLRVENTQTKGNSITLNQINTNNYIQFFPTTYIQYTSNENNAFSLNFGRRLARPRYNELNPFKVYYNPYSYTQGNPFLSPSYTNNIEFQHVYKDILFTSLSFSKTTNGIGNPPFFNEETKVQYLLDLNYYTSNSYNISETYVFNQFKWWESENQANVFYKTTHITKDIDLKGNRGLSAYFSTNNSFTLNKNKTVKGEVNFWYQAPGYEDIYKTESTSSLDLGLKFSLLDNSLQLAFIAQDIFKSNIAKSGTTSSSIGYRFSDYNDSRYFRISMSYKFGSRKLNLKQRGFGNEEEKRRADQ